MFVAAVSVVRLGEGRQRRASRRRAAAMRRRKVRQISEARERLSSTVSSM